MIQVQGASYAPGGNPILKDFQLELMPGTINALVGPSGCGKSTLLRILAGLRPLDSGKVVGVPARKAFVFQDAALLPWMTARENVALIGAFRPVGDVDEALSRVGLTEHAHKLPSALSGGQRMRVSLARALVGQPELVLLDEAFGALDGITRRSVQRVFLRLAEHQHWTVVMVTHEPEEAALLADRILAVDGTPLRVLEDRPILSPPPRQIPDGTLWTAKAPVPEPFEPTDDSTFTLPNGGARSVRLPVASPPGALEAPTAWSDRAWALLAVAAGLGLWAMIAARVGPLLLASPQAVLGSFWSDQQRLWEGTVQTGRSAGLGLLMAFVLASVAAVGAWASRALRLALLPYVTFLQIVPIVAIAPLLVVWLGYGGGVPLATTVIACFYPIYSSVSTGLVAPSVDQVDLLRLYGAGTLQELWYLRLPAAMPSVFAGLKTAAGLSVIGAIVGEFVGSNGAPATLGFLVVFGARSARTDLGFAAVVCAGLLALGLHALVQMWERRSIGHWYGA